MSAKMHASQKSYHNHISETKLFWLIGLFTIIGKDSNDEVATEQLTTEIDFTFIPHDNPKISQTQFGWSRDPLIKTGQAIA